MCLIKNDKQYAHKPLALFYFTKVKINGIIKLKLSKTIIIFLRGVVNMTVNLQTDIDIQIEKLNQMLEKLDLLEDKTNMIKFITIKEFAQIRQCSQQVAQRIFNLPDFPSENYAKQKAVELRGAKRMVQDQKR